MLGPAKATRRLSALRNRGNNLTPQSALSVSRIGHTSTQANFFTVTFNCVKFIIFGFFVRFQEKLVKIRHKSNEKYGLKVICLIERMQFFICPTNLFS